MELSWADPNYGKDFQDIIEGVNHQESVCILWRENIYINQTKQGGQSGYKNSVMNSNRELLLH